MNTKILTLLTLQLNVSYFGAFFGYKKTQNWIAQRSCNRFLLVEMRGRFAPYRGPTYPVVGQVGPFVTRSAMSQTVSYITIVLPFIDITHLGKILTLSLNLEWFL